MAESSIVSHSDLSDFAHQKVNLGTDPLNRYRTQVRNLQESLERYIQDNPEYDLVKTLRAGSVAKGTALSTINDMDLAIYVRPSDQTTNEAQLLNWLRERLLEAKPPNVDPDQIPIPDSGSHCVRISYKGSGLDVDVVPIIHTGEDDDRGYLIPKDGGGARVLTSIPLHLAFIHRRKELSENFTQVVRFIKWWVRQRKGENNEFRFKSFMVELICAHLADQGKIDLDDYRLAMADFFLYIITSQLKKRIAFTDNYHLEELPEPTGNPIEIFDPVNPQNNVASRYTEYQRQLIVEEAQKAFDAISGAMPAVTKERAVQLWKKVLGPSFNP